MVGKKICSCFRLLKSYQVPKDKADQEARVRQGDLEILELLVDQEFLAQLALLDLQDTATRTLVWATMLEVCLVQSNSYSDC